MTPKEKAKELVDRYLNVSFGIIQEYIPVPLPHAKQCALIAVDEIEKAERNVLLKFSLINEDMVMHYWQLVKQEIEKL